MLPLSDPRKEKLPRKLQSIISEDKYLASLIPLKDYKDEFEVPEVWLPQETPITVVKRKIIRRGSST